MVGKSENYVIVMSFCFTICFNDVRNHVTNDTKPTRPYINKSLILLSKLIFSLNLLFNSVFFGINYQFICIFAFDMPKGIKQ